MSIARQIVAALRDAEGRGLRRLDLAHSINITPAKLARIVSGQDLPTIDIAERIAVAAGFALALVVTEHAALLRYDPTPELSGTPRSRVFTIAQLRKMGLGSRPTIYRNMAAGKFPVCFRVGGKCVWRESAIIAYLDKKAAGGK